jgi:hypothetical protein
MIEALGVQYGREDSFKLTKAGLKSHRFLMGIPTHDLAPDRVLRLCDELGMPGRLRSAFAEHLAEANMVGVGREDGPEDGVYKMYLEFWDRVRSQVRRSGRPDPLLLHLGFKWRARGDARDGRIARYICFPMLSVHDTLARIGQTYADAAPPTAQHVTLGIVRHAVAATPGTPFLYSEAHEEGGTRGTFDINLYKSELTIRDIDPYLQDLGRHYGVADADFRPLLARIGPRLLGHVSGGLDPGGNEATAVYYETRPLDP